MPQIHKNFFLFDVVSVAVGLVVTHRRLIGPMEVMAFMVDVDNNDMSVPEAYARCRPALIRQFPALGRLDPTGLNSANLRHWKQDCFSKFGAHYLPVWPLSDLDWADPAPLTPPRSRSPVMFETRGGDSHAAYAGK